MIVMTALSAANHEDGIYNPPLPLAGEGWGEAEAEGDPLASGPLASGYNVYCFPLTVSPCDTPSIKISEW